MFGYFQESRVQLQEEIVGGNEEREPEEHDLVNLAQVKLNLGDETDDNQVLPLD